MQAAKVQVHGKVWAGKAGQQKGLLAGKVCVEGMQKCWQGRGKQKAAAVAVASGGSWGTGVEVEWKRREGRHGRKARWQAMGGSRQGIEGTRRYGSSTLVNGKTQGQWLHEW